MSDTLEDHARTRYAERYEERTGFSPDRWCEDCEDHPKLVPGEDGSYLAMECGHHPEKMFLDEEDERFCGDCFHYSVHLEPDPDNQPYFLHICSYCREIWGDCILPEKGVDSHGS